MAMLHMMAFLMGLTWQPCLVICLHNVSHLIFSGVQSVACRICMQTLWAS